MSADTDRCECGHDHDEHDETGCSRCRRMYIEERWCQRTYEVAPAPLDDYPLTDSSDDLDLEIADMVERMRQELWKSAAFFWQTHNEEPYDRAQLLIHDDDWLIPGYIHVWQTAIDSGHAQPVTEETRRKPDLVPDLPWPGLGADWGDKGENPKHPWWFMAVWDVISDSLGDRFYTRSMELERRWVEREVMRKLDMDSLFEDGWWKTNGNQGIQLGYTMIERPAFFDGLIAKIDPEGAPDFVTGWWDEEVDKEDRG